MRSSLLGTMVSRTPYVGQIGVERIVKAIGLGSAGAFNLEALRIGDVLFQVTDLIRTHKVKIEPNMTTLFTAIIVLEGLGRQLDPECDLFGAALSILA